MRVPWSLLARILPCTAAPALSGCTVTSAVKLYDGPERDPSQIALLYVDPHVAITRIDTITEHPGDKSRVLVHSAGKRREIVAIAPGQHELLAHFFVLCLRSEGEIPLRFDANAGRKYRLKSVVDIDAKRWSPAIVEYSGEDIEDTFPWMQALCRVRVDVVTLHR